MAKLLKGAPVAAALHAQTSQRVSELRALGVTPTLAILRVGERPDDIAYENGAVKRCEKVGVKVRKVTLPEDAAQDELVRVIKSLNGDRSIHGVLMLRPLPKHINEAEVCDILAPEKDVDGITSTSMAGVFSGTALGYPPCTPQACMEILEHYGIELNGKRTVVIGRSLVVGKPAAMLLIQRHATVTVCHTRTENMADLCRDADLLLVAAGRANVVDKSYLSPGQIVLDVGISVDAEGKLCGDVCFSQAEPVVKAITPVPGGVGAVTTSVLVKHVVDAVAKAIAGEQ